MIFRIHNVAGNLETLAKIKSKIPRDSLPYEQARELDYVELGL